MKLSAHQLRFSLTALIVVASVIFCLILGSIDYFPYTLLAGILFVFMPVHNWLVTKKIGAKFLGSVAWFHVVISLPAALIVGTVQFINAFLARGCTAGVTMEMGGIHCRPVEADIGTPAFIQGGFIPTLAFWLLLISVLFIFLVTPLVSLSQLKHAAQQRIKS